MCAAALIVSGAVSLSAQIVNDGMAAGIARQSLAQADAAIDMVPNLLSQGLEIARVGHEFETQENCLGNVQNVVNMGAVVSDMMPFSSVAIFEDNRGPVGRLRVMINGQKIHVDVFCDGETLKALDLPWGEGDEDPRDYSRGALGAILGVGLNLKLQGVFESEPLPVNERAVSNSGGAVPYLDDGINFPSALGQANPSVNLEPMTSAERESFRKSVVRCWNFDPGSAAAAATLVVAFKLDRSGKPDGDVTLLSASGGDEAAQNIAFHSVRRAVLRCGGFGFDLPADKFEQWQNIEMTFDPSGVRVR